MPRVKCPHCGAGNQDATEKDTCWQCSNVLGASVARPVMPEPVETPANTTPTQQLHREEVPPPVRAANANTMQRTLTIALVVAVLLIGLLMIVLFVMASRR
jgi:hypothetical protein